MWHFIRHWSKFYWPALFSENKLAGQYTTRHQPFACMHEYEINDACTGQEITVCHVNLHITVYAIINVVQISAVCKNKLIAVLVKADHGVNGDNCGFRARSEEIARESESKFR